MSIVMQAAQAGSIADAERIEAALAELIASCAAYERAHYASENVKPVTVRTAPWSAPTIPEPLVAFGERHGVPWPRTEEARFVLRGTFPEDVSLLRVDRLVFFWCDGFEL